MSCKAEIISPQQLFCILFTVRLSALFLTREISLLSLAVQLGLTLVLSALAYAASLRLKSEINNKAALFAAALTVAAPSVLSLADFREKAASNSLPAAMMIIILAVGVGYSSSLKTVSTARFSPFGAAALTVCVIAGFFGNIGGISLESISIKATGISTLEILKCADIPAVFLMLCGKTEKKAGRALFYSVFASYTAFGLLFFMCAVKLKNAADYYSYPVFTLLQLAQAGSFNKLDTAFTIPLIIGEFIKYSSVFSRLKNEKIR